MKRNKIEIIDLAKIKHKPSSIYTKPTNLANICLLCKKRLKVDFFGNNAHTFPNIYGGVVFRSTGQYGSTVWDQPHSSDWGDNIQIVICDSCITKNSLLVNTFKNERIVIERRPFADVAVTYEDYGTLEEYIKWLENLTKAKPISKVNLPRKKVKGKVIRYHLGKL